MLVCLHTQGLKFHEEALGGIRKPSPLEQQIGFVKGAAAKGHMLVWENDEGVPVSTAAIVREMDFGMSLSWVYTPVEYVRFCFRSLLLYSTRLLFFSLLHFFS